MKRGILGVLRDPKKQTLFSFRPQPGAEWPSSDSNDSDYEVPVKEVSPKKIKTNKRKVMISRGSKTKKIKAEENDNSCDSATTEELDLGSYNSASQVVESLNAAPEPGSSSDQKVWLKNDDLENNLDPQDNRWSCLPTTALLNIFKLVVDSFGPLPFLCRAAQVSRSWNDIARHSVLWKKIDLSYGWIKKEDKVLIMLCEKRFSKLTDLNLSSWKKLQHSSFVKLADSCPHLSSIDLSQTKISGAVLLYLVDKCPNIVSLTLSSMQKDAASNKTLVGVFERRGANLRSLILRDNKLVAFNDFFKSLTTRCHRLETFELSNSKKHDCCVVNILQLQAGCPNMKYLRLTNMTIKFTPISDSELDKSPGFPKLLELSLCGTNLCGSSADNNILNRILKNSVDLKLLDLRDCNKISCDCLQTLPATDLQMLYIKSSVVATYDGINVVLSKWQHSLVELDLSWNSYPAMNLDKAIKNLASDRSKSKLEIIDLRGTQTLCSSVKSLLHGCPKIKHLYLESCRSLPRGMKKEYSGSLLKQLRKDINSFPDNYGIEAD